MPSKYRVPTTRSWCRGGHGQNYRPVGPVITETGMEQGQTAKFPVTSRAVRLHRQGEKHRVVMRIGRLSQELHLPFPNVTHCGSRVQRGCLLQLQSERDDVPVQESGVHSWAGSTPYARHVIRGNGLPEQRECELRGKRESHSLPSRLCRKRPSPASPLRSPSSSCSFPLAAPLPRILGSLMSPPIPTLKLQANPRLSWSTAVLSITLTRTSHSNTPGLPWTGVSILRGRKLVLLPAGLMQLVVIVN